MNAIDQLFKDLRTARRMAFMPFLTAGDPDLAGTEALLNEVVARGADLIELGFPYSDPIADGPVVQASYTRALAKGVKLDAIFEFVRTWTKANAGFPLAAMVSYSIIHRAGLPRFVERARMAGFSGLIVPDLPVEESQPLADLAAKNELKLIQLITPTTPRDRAAQIAKASTGFIYYVSVTGITGARDQLPPELRGQLAWLRTQTDLPICVGFGISKPEHVRMLKNLADGIIVGSALVRKLENLGKQTLPQVVAEVGELAATLKKAMD